MIPHPDRIKKNHPYPALSWKCKSKECNNKDDDGDRISCSGCMKCVDYMESLTFKKQQKIYCSECLGENLFESLVSFEEETKPINPEIINCIIETIGVRLASNLFIFDPHVAYEHLCVGSNKNYTPNLDDMKEKHTLWNMKDKILITPIKNSTDNQTYKNTTLIAYVKNNIPKGWEAFCEDQLDEYGGLIKTSEFLWKEAQKDVEIFPPLNLVYNAFNLVKPEDVKVVIIGQDPYPTPGDAMGVCFSVSPGVAPPKSLINIYKELKDCGYRCDPKSGDLTKWCKEGVLMINTTLTVESGLSESHKKKKVWDDFSTALMIWLNINLPPCVFMLWGSPAIQSAKNIDIKKHRKVEATHPSPLGANKASSVAQAFIGSKPFTKANDQLKLLRRKPVDWNLI